MKKILLIAMCLFCTLPTFAKPYIPYISGIPYKEYTKELKEELVEKFDYSDENVEITKKQLKFKSYYLTEMGQPYEYIITNKSDNDIVLKGMNTGKEFWNRDYNLKHGNIYRVMTGVALREPVTYAPLYSQVKTGQADVEKNKFIRDFPRNKTLKPNEQIRILAFGLDKHKIQNIKMMFIIDNEEKEIEF